MQNTIKDRFISKFASNNGNDDNNQRRDPRFSMNNRPPRKTNNQLLLLLAMVGIIIVIAMAYQGPMVSSTQVVDFTTFYSMVKDGKVSEIVIDDGGSITFKSAGSFQDTVYEVYAPWVLKDSSIMDELINSGARIKGKHNSGDLWLTIIFNIVPLLLFVFIFFSMMRSVSGRGGNQAFTFTKSPAKRLGKDRKKVTFKDVAGVDEAIEDLQEMVMFLKNPQKFKKLKARMPKGVLLVGPPGTGKTLLSRAVAGEADVPFFHMSGSDFVELFVGVGASRVRDLFAQAKAASPSVIFIDEIDAVGRHRGAGLGGGHDEREQTLNQILVEMDGFEGNEGVIVMAATNRPDILDRALLRPGRFDRKVVVDPPDVRGREKILEIYLKDRPKADEVQIPILAKRTPGFVGADLENLVNEAALLALRAEREQINMEDMEEAIDRVIAGPERKSRILSAEEREIVAYHELGHAIIPTVLKTNEPVHRVSIIPRGHAALGYTLQLPEKDKYLNSKTELQNRIIGLLGGRAAEQYFFEEITTGASNDIERATKLARSMVCQLGMSENMGPVMWENEEQEVFLGKEISKTRNSEKIAFQIDLEVKDLINKSYQKALDIIARFSREIRHLAGILLEEEVLEGDYLRELLEKEVSSHVNGKSENTENIEIPENETKEQD
ncbi:MAG TPA: ATP-dependent zinc metalloprotease FtsH [Thermotogota bacterium]|nr:ATP-dependent zinc metalloprotease FtsH [Thermotogota bacterium]HPR96089.1 ATP-dependent zinc metalloprotease FtsH [Thermotogota bacterium]